MKESSTYIWIQAFRLRTLPLALANAIMGSLLAAAEQNFKWGIFFLTLLTITFLQILSNLANDYGDAVSGADRPDRVGPTRVTATGMVTRREMKNMVIAFVILSFISGSLLIYFGLRHLNWKHIALFFTLGIAAITAAVKYTVGKNPYGYRGLGDLFVFLFFGLVGVMGTYYLHTHHLNALIILPASAIGLMSTGVLNINNLRDIEADKESGKRTLAVLYGARYSKRYHVALITSAWILAILYAAILHKSWGQLIGLLTLPLFIKNCWKIFTYKESVELNKELGNLSLSTFLFALTYGAGLILPI